MASPAVTAKALKLLGEERVRFEGSVVNVRGMTGDYEIQFDGQRWYCSCECRHSKCAHITAAQIVYRALMGAGKGD